MAGPCSWEGVSWFDPRVVGVGLLLVYCCGREWMEVGGVPRGTKKITAKKNTGKGAK